MAEKVISVKINVDDKSLDQLEGDLQGIGIELKKIEETSSGLSLEQKLSAADGAIKVMAGSLQSVVGALGILGVESEAFGEFEKRAVSVIAFSMGIKDLSEGVGKLAVAYKEAGGAAKIFGKVSKQALISTGIGAFVVALGLAVAYWDEITEFIQGGNRELKAANRLVDAQRKLLDQNRVVLERRKTLIELEKGSLVDINAELKKNLETDLQLAESKLINLNTQLLIEQSKAREASTTRKILTAFKNLGDIQATSIELAKLNAGISANSEKVQEKILEITEQIFNLKKGIKILDNEAENTAAEIAKKEEDRLKAYQDILGKYVTGLEDLKADSNQKILDLEKKRAKEEIDNLKLTDEEKKKAYEAFEAYFKEKQEQLTKITKEEAQKRLNIEVRNLLDAQTNLQQLKIDNIADDRTRLTEQRDFELGVIDQELADKKAALETQLGDNAEFNAAIQAQIDTADEVALEKKKRVNAQFLSEDEYLRAEQQMNIDTLNAYRVDSYATAAGAISDLISFALEGSKEAQILGIVIEKAAAIAKIIAGTAVANTAALVLPPILREKTIAANMLAQKVNIGATVAAGGIAIATIKNPTEGGGGNTAPSSGPGSIGAPVSNNEAINAPRFEPQERSIRTYVLSGDVTSSQEADAKINRRRSLS